MLSGHVHDPFDVPVERNGWTLRMIGAGTLSKRTRGSPPAFNEIRIDAGSFKTIARTMDNKPARSISETTASGS